MASKAKVAPKKPAKKKNGYEAPKKLKSGTVLIDNFKKQWKIGVSIGIGGFGEIYSACDAASAIKKLEDYPYVVKIEPHNNGPLFVEMHFYMRLGKKDDIEKFAKDNKIKYLGMPFLVGSGSQDIEDLKHRFLVMPRYGSDIWKIFLEQNRKFPLHTVYRLGWQLLNILEYIHINTYVHMDIKGANILLGFDKKGGDEQVHLLDYGLACHYNTKDYKVDPKKAHNGTIEYTSRDAHNGVATIRGDIEILAYNLIEWAGAKLPWTTSQQVLQKPVEVQKMKEEFMKNVDKALKSSFGTMDVPSQLRTFMKYVESLKHDELPDYKKMRGFFESGLKELKQSNSGKLEFHMPKAGTSKNAAAAKSPVKRTHQGDDNEVKKKSAKQPKVLVPPTDDSTDEEITVRSKRLRNRKQYMEVDSDDDDNEEQPVKQKPKVKAASPQKKKSDDKKERKQLMEIDSDDDDDQKEKRQKQKPPSSKVKSSPEKNENKEANEKSPQKKKRDDKVKAKGQVVLKSKSNSSKKTVQLNFDLNVSFDSDLVVTINRKDKKSDDEKKKGDDNDSQNQNQAGYYKGKYAKT